MKYFKSPHSRKIEHLADVVPVVLALEPERVKRLVVKTATLIELEKKASKTKEEINELVRRREELKKDPVQLVILQEIIMQLEYFNELISARNDEYSKKLRRDFEMGIKIYSEILERKREELSGVGIPNDKSAKEISDWILFRRRHPKSA